MKRKIYCSPEIEILTFETEGIMAHSEGLDVGPEGPTDPTVPQSRGSEATSSKEYFKSTQRQTFNRSFTRK